jgi:hypothetical protein
MRSVTSKHNHQTTLQYLVYFQHQGALNQSPPAAQPSHGTPSNPQNPWREFAPARPLFLSGFQLVIMETANGDNIAKFALMSGADGNVRSRTVRAWPEAEMIKLISELP